MRQSNRFFQVSAIFATSFVTFVSDVLFFEFSHGASCRDETENKPKIPGGYYV
jgi:hypothetical protein